MSLARIHHTFDSHHRDATAYAEVTLAGAECGNSDEALLSLAGCLEDHAARIRKAVLDPVPAPAPDLPLHDAAHVRQSMAELGFRPLTPLQRAIAIDRILRAAYKHGVDTLEFVAALVEGRS